MLHTLAAGSRVTNLKRIEKLPPLWLAFIMPESAMHTTKGKKDINVLYPVLDRP